MTSLYRVLAFFVLVQFTTHLSYSQPPGYYYVREVTINAGQIPDGTNLIDFPFLFRFTHPDFRSVANGGHIENSNGFDVLFYQNSCSTPMDYQLDYYNPTTGELAAWVRVPVLSTTADTKIYIYYGNNTVLVPSSTSTVWDAGYSGIWHLGDNPAGTAPQITDATGHGHNGTTYGAMTGANLVSGKIGQAFSFDETNDHVRIPDFLYGQELTVSFWFNAAEVNGASYQYLFSHGTWATQNSLNVYVGEDNIIIPSEIQNRSMLKTVFRDANDANNFDTLDAGTTWMDGNWHYYTIRIQNFGGATIYIDGTQVAVYSVWGANTFNPPTDIFLGAREDLNPGRFYGGRLDEVRISTIWRTSNWIKTEYNNQNNPGLFSSLGLEAPSLGYCYPLALSFQNFSVRRNREIVELCWSVAQKPDTGLYTIQRSEDGMSWQTISKISAVYSFIDYRAPLSTVYYRILYSDEANMRVSVTKLVPPFGQPSIHVFPNPAPSGVIHLVLPEAGKADEFSLTSINGKVHQFSINAETNGYLISISRHLKGLYILRFRYRSAYLSKQVFFQ